MIKYIVKKIVQAVILKIYSKMKWLNLIDNNPNPILESYRKVYPSEKWEDKNKNACCSKSLLNPPPPKKRKLGTYRHKFDQK